MLGPISWRTVLLSATRLSQWIICLCKYRLSISYSASSVMIPSFPTKCAVCRVVWKQSSSWYANSSVQWRVICICIHITYALNPKFFGVAWCVIREDTIFIVHNIKIYLIFFSSVRALSFYSVPILDSFRPLIYRYPSEMPRHPIKVYCR